MASKKCRPWSLRFGWRYCVPALQTEKKLPTLGRKEEGAEKTYNVRAVEPKMRVEGREEKRREGQHWTSRERGAVRGTREAGGGIAREKKHANMIRLFRTGDESNATAVLAAFQLDGTDDINIQESKRLIFAVQ